MDQYLSFAVATWELTSGLEHQDVSVKYWVTEWLILTLPSHGWGKCWQWWECCVHCIMVLLHSSAGRCPRVIQIKRRYFCPVGLRVPTGLFCTDLHLMLQKEWSVSQKLSWIGNFANHILEKKPNSTEKTPNPPPPHPPRPLWKWNTLTAFIYSLLFSMCSADLSACPGGAPRSAHQSHVAVGGERAGGDGAAQLALPGGDGQFPAQHGTAAEDSDWAGQAGQLLIPWGCCHTGQNPGWCGEERGNCATGAEGAQPWAPLGLSGEQSSSWLRQWYWKLFLQALKAMLAREIFPSYLYRGERNKVFWDSRSCGQQAGCTVSCYDPELSHQLCINLRDVGTESWSEKAGECSAVQWLLSGEPASWSLSMGYVEQLITEFMGKCSVSV